MPKSAEPLSRAIALITALQDMGANVRVFDPVGMDQAKKVLNGVTYSSGPYDCATNADALVIVTEWEQFRALDFVQLKQVMTQPIVVDLRNIYQSEEVERQGFRYCGVGKGGRAQKANAVRELQARAALVR